MPPPRTGGCRPPGGPARRARTVAGISGLVAIVQHDRGDQAAPPPLGVNLRWAWTIERTRGGAVLHEYGCGRAPADGPELSLDDAVTAYARPGARACGECAAAEVLDRL
ncbi:DUF6233 domain-containing protein [Streptomyces virginiae]|uniref:DUF6233 domain-containing protein n=1 Tax=Streptomyces virginiae TaxID=1961 RepID=UPI0033AD1F34